MTPTKAKRLIVDVGCGCEIIFDARDNPMTPTQAQIEAAAKEIIRNNDYPIRLKTARALATNALTAAAEVGLPQGRAPGQGTNEDLVAAVAAADAYRDGYRVGVRKAADEIERLRRWRREMERTLPAQLLTDVDDAADEIERLRKSLAIADDALIAMRPLVAAIRALKDEP